MKIINREEFLRLSRNTVYCKYKPTFFGNLEIKGDTISHGNKMIDWFNQQIEDAIECDDSEHFSDLCFESEKFGKKLRFDFKCEGRDGMYDKEQLFAVWDNSDILNLIKRLTECLDQGVKNNV